MNKDKKNTIDVKQKTYLTSVEKQRNRFSAKYFMQGAGKHLRDSLFFNTKKMLEKFDLTLPEPKKIQQNTQEKRLINKRGLLLTGLAIGSVALIYVAIEKIEKGAVSNFINKIVNFDYKGVFNNVTRFATIVPDVLKDPKNEKLVDNIETIKKSVGLIFGNEEAFKTYGVLLSQNQRKYGIWGDLTRAAATTGFYKIMSDLGMGLVLMFLGCDSYRYRISKMKMINGGDFEKLSQEINQWQTKTLNSTSGHYIIDKDLVNASNTSAEVATWVGTAAVGAAASVYFAPLAVPLGIIAGVFATYSLIAGIFSGRWDMLDDTSKKYLDRIIERQNLAIAKINKEVRDGLINTDKDTAFLLNRLKFNLQDYQNVKSYLFGWSSLSFVTEKDGEIMHQGVFRSGGANGIGIPQLIAPHEGEKAKLINKTLHELDQTIALYKDDSSYAQELLEMWGNFLNSVEFWNDANLNKLFSFVPFVARLLNLGHLKGVKMSQGVFSQFTLKSEIEKTSKKLDNEMENRYRQINQNYQKYINGQMSAKNYFSNTVELIKSKIFDLYHSYSLEIEKFKTIYQRRLVGSVNFSSWQKGVRKLIDELHKNNDISNVLMFSNKGMSLDYTPVSANVDEIDRYKSKEVIYPDAWQLWLNDEIVQREVKEFNTDRDREVNTIVDFGNEKFILIEKTLKEEGKIKRCRAVTEHGVTQWTEKYDVYSYKMKKFNGKIRLSYQQVIEFNFEEKCYYKNLYLTRYKYKCDVSDELEELLERGPDSFTQGELLKSEKINFKGSQKIKNTIQENSKPVVQILSDVRSRSNQLFEQLKTNYSRRAVLLYEMEALFN